MTEEQIIQKCYAISSLQTRRGRLQLEGKDTLSLTRAIEREIMELRKIVDEERQEGVE
jgi:hypothetical protein